MENPLAERTRIIHRILDAGSPPVIDFLDAADPFQLLVMVMLSAQTTDRQVNKVAPALFERYPTPADLAEADVAHVKDIIRSTGYYNAKAKHIVETSQAVVRRFRGEVPLDMERLTSLPGVGRKTAGVVLGRIAGSPVIIVDTHFGRVVRRLGLTTAKDPRNIERDIAQLLPPAWHYRFSMTVNRHGRLVCRARKPACLACALGAWCDSYPLQ